ncbi:hypothetical protein II906_01300 [bacterium]|nr:hypothetical protein [bacterium]
MGFYNSVENFFQLQDIDEYYKTLKNKVLSEASSKTPTIIRNDKKNQIWLFFFKDGMAKFLWIYDYNDMSKRQYEVSKDIQAVCSVDGYIYAIDKDVRIYRLSIEKSQ